MVRALARISIVTAEMKYCLVVVNIWIVEIEELNIILLFELTAVYIF